MQTYLSFKCHFPLKGTKTPLEKQLTPGRRHKTNKNKNQGGPSTSCYATSKKCWKNPGDTPRTQVPAPRSAHWLRDNLRIATAVSAGCYDCCTKQETTESVRHKQMLSRGKGTLLLAGERLSHTQKERGGRKSPPGDRPRTTSPSCHSP